MQVNFVIFPNNNQILVFFEALECMQSHRMIFQLFDTLYNFEESAVLEEG